MPRGGGSGRREESEQTRSWIDGNLIKLNARKFASKFDNFILITTSSVKDPLSTRWLPQSYANFSSTPPLCSLWKALRQTKVFHWIFPHLGPESKKGRNIDADPSKRNFLIGLTLNREEKYLHNEIQSPPCNLFIIEFRHSSDFCLLEKMAWHVR